MRISMYQACVPVFARALGNLRHILQQGEAHARERDMKPELLLQSRLAPDMLPLVSQVQIATDLAKNGCARLAGVELLKLDEIAPDFEQAQARIDRVVAYLGEFEPGQFEGSEERQLTISTGSDGELTFSGLDYLLYFSQPNVYFHVTTAYAILRQAGVALGKRDFIGAPPGP